jgi:uncharacterized protein
MQHDAQPKPGKRRKFFSRPNHDLRDAIKRGDLEGVKESLAAGARIDGGSNCFLKPPLALAAKHGHRHIVEFLLDQNANIEVTDPQLCTPLIIAAANGQAETVRLLLERGAKIDARGGQDCTALIAAVTHHSAGTVKILVDHGADMTIRGGPPTWAAKLTAMQWAVSDAQAEIIALLEAPERARQSAGWVEIAKRMNAARQQENAAPATAEPKDTPPTAAKRQGGFTL